MPKDIIITDGNETYYTLQVPVNEFVESIISDNDINELEFFLNTFINYKFSIRLQEGLLNLVDLGLVERHGGTRQECLEAIQSLRYSYSQMLRQTRKKIQYHKMLIRNVDLTVNEMFKKLGELQ